MLKGPPSHAHRTLKQRGGVDMPAAHHHRRVLANRNFIRVAIYGKVLDRYSPEAIMRSLPSQQSKIAGRLARGRAGVCAVLRGHYIEGASAANVANSSGG
jgi:hypothetical protein